MNQLTGAMIRQAQREAYQGQLDTDGHFERMAAWLNAQRAAHTVDHEAGVTCLPTVELAAKDQEIKRLREWSRVGAELDNHHAASACPYCNPDQVMFARDREIARVVTETRQLLKEKNEALAAKDAETASLASELHMASRETARLMAVNGESNAVCSCGCAVVDHEELGEDGWACESPDHLCIPTSKAVEQLLRKSEAALATERQKMRELSVEVRSKYEQASRQYAADTTDDYEEGRADAFGHVVAAFDQLGLTGEAQPTTASSIRQQVLRDVNAERDKQESKWGEQNHDPFTYLTVLGEEFGELCQAVLHLRFGGDAAAGLRKEAVQTAAVALAIVECLDRGKWTFRSDVDGSGNPLTTTEASS